MDNWRALNMHGIMRCLKAKGVEVIVLDDVNKFKKRANVIVANCLINELGEVKDKVYARLI